MVLSKTHKFVYFANPRTGSTSLGAHLNQYNEFYKINEINASLFPNMGDYRNISQAGVLNILQSKNETIDFSDYYEFVFVRNPYTRILSLFKMLKNLHPKHNSRIEADDIRKRKNMTFERFLDKIEGVFNGSIVYDTLSYSQLKYTTNPLTSNLHVYKFEELESNFNTIKHDLDLDLGVLRHLNFIPPAINSEELLPQHKERIYNLFREEFEEFGYSK